MIHYHGTPLSPRSELLRMAGKHFCVPFSDPRDIEPCLQIGQSLMLDNGAFSAFTRHVRLDVDGFYSWIEPIIAHPHWAVIPDVIGGTVNNQRDLIAGWPFPRELGAPVYHLGLPIEFLLELVDAWPRVCIGSSGEFWNVGSPKWSAQMDKTFNALAKHRTYLPWIHGLRMMAQTEYPLASADSVNVARNFKDAYQCPSCMASKIDSRQALTRWTERQTQESLFA